MADFVSDAFAPDALLAPHRRLDIELHGVDQTAPSYEARIFLSNPEADHNTERSAENGYLGSFHVFGKAGCWGEEGHCDEPASRRKFDHRRVPTRYAKIRVTAENDITEIPRLGTEETTICIVAVLPEDSRDSSGREAVLRFTRFSLITYL